MYDKEVVYFLKVWSDVTKDKHAENMSQGYMHRKQAKHGDKNLFN